MPEIEGSLSDGGRSIRTTYVDGFGSKPFPWPEFCPSEPPFLDSATVRPKCSGIEEFWLYICLEKSMARIHTHGQNSGHGNALKQKPEKYIVLLDRPLNSPMSTSQPTPAFATLREHSVRRLQGLDSRPAEDSLFTVAENAQPCSVPYQSHGVIWNSEKLQRPANGSRASLPGSVSFPQTLPRGPATERPSREIRAVCGAAHLHNLQVDDIVQLFVAHISYVRPS